MSRWPEVALGEVLNLHLDAVPVDPVAEYPIAGVYGFGRGLFKRESLSGSETTYKTFNRLHDSDLVISQLKAWEGAIALITPEFEGWYLSPQFATFRARTDRVDTRYVNWFCKRATLWEQLDRGSRGMGARRNSVSPKQFLQTLMPLPPVEEQRRVVRRIEQLAALQQRAARMSVDAESKTSRLLPTAIDKLLHGRLEELPSGWNRIRVGDLGCPGVDTVQTGPFGAQLHKSDYRDEGHPVLAIGNVQWGFLDHSHVDHVSGDKATALARYALAEGDVLFTRSGTVGRSAVVPPLADGWLMTGHILRIRLDKCRALPRFVFLAMQGCSSVRSQIEEGARGATRAGFNTSLLSRIELPMPSIGEQEAIVRRLQILESQLGLVGRLQDSVSASYDALVHSALGTLLGR